MDNILRVGNNLYSYLHASTGRDLLLLSEVHNILSIDDRAYRLMYGDSMSGDVNMSESRDCYFSLF